MKKTSAFVLIFCALLLAAALVLGGTTGYNGKAYKGESAVYIEMGKTFDAATVQIAAEAAGFKNIILVESGRTTIEVLADVMSETELQAAADQLVAAIKADAPDAVLAYADIVPPTGSRNLSKLLWAALAFAIVACIYAGIRFGFCKGIAAVLTAVVAATATASICAIASAVFALGSVTTAVTAGVACTTFAFTVAAYANAKKGIPAKKSDIAPVLLFAVGTVLVCVSCGTLALTLTAVLGAVVTVLSVQFVAPIFWGACAK